MGTPALEDRLVDPAVLRRALREEATWRICCDHFDFEHHEALLDPVRDPTLRLVLLVRNPVDAILSSFYRREGFGELPDPEVGALDNLRAYLRGAFIEDPAGAGAVRAGPSFRLGFRDHVERYAIRWLRSGRAWVVRYEDLVADPVTTLVGVLEHLEIPYSMQRVRDAVDAHSFERLSGGRRPGTEDRSAHYRRGVPGEWRRLGTADLARVCEPIRDFLPDLAPELDRELRRAAPAISRPVPSV